MYEFKSQLQARTTEKLIETIHNKDKRLNEKHVANPTKKNAPKSSANKIK